MGVALFVSKLDFIEGILFSTSLGQARSGIWELALCFSAPAPSGQQSPSEKVCRGRMLKSVREGKVVKSCLIVGRQQGRAHDPQFTCNRSLNENRKQRIFTLREEVGINRK